MAIRTVVTRGFGNGTFNGTIPLVVTRGYAIGIGVATPVARIMNILGEIRTLSIMSESRIMDVGYEGRIQDVDFEDRTMDIDSESRTKGNQP